MSGTRNQLPDRPGPGRGDASGAGPGEDGSSGRPRRRGLRPAPIEWLLLGVGLVLVVRYRWLMDDAFVYFRYIDNFLFLDLGLVYNAGEYVEGYSSPLHLLLLSGLRALELGWPAIITGLGCVAFLAFWLGIVAVNRALAPRGAAPLNLPLAYLATSYGLTSFFTSGLETPLAQLMAPAVALYLLRPQSRALALAVALAPLARPELAVAVAMAGAFAWWRRGSFPWWLATATLAANAGWLLFRVYYYADLLPNTFYLKDDVRFGQGLRYLADTGATYHVGAFAAVVAGLALYVRTRPARPGGRGFAFHAAERAAMLAIAGAIALYVARVGGSHVHYWYLAFPFSLAVCASAGLVEAALQGQPARRRRVLGPVAMLAVSLAVFAQVPPQLSAHPLAADVRHEPVHFIDAPLWHRRHERLALDGAFGSGASPDALRALGERIAASGPRRTRAGTWCETHYTDLADRWVHGFGLTDALLARTRAGWLKPGHKIALIPLSEDIARLQNEAVVQGRGMYRRAVESGRAPGWVAANLEAIEAIERKVHHRHDFRENLALALRPPRRIEIPPSERPQAGRPPTRPGPVAPPASKPMVPPW